MAEVKSYLISSDKTDLKWFCLIVLLSGLMKHKTLEQQYSEDIHLLNLAYDYYDWNWNMLHFCTVCVYNGIVNVDA